MEGLMIKVLEMDGHRIARVRVSRGSGLVAEEDAKITENSVDIESANSSHKDPSVSEADKSSATVGNTNQERE